MLENLNRFERGIYFVLLVMLAGVILIAVIELGIILIESLLIDFTFRLNNEEILNIFGFFLLILIGIELMETIKAYLTKNELHFEIIILLAIIAVSRKIILLDPFSSSSPSDSGYLVGLGVIIIALGGCYYLIKKAGISK
ncbi:MAG TPA: phosphate-starvation-inducible PsiE family protein [Methanoregulaceae archaeon]|nr:phosphate-starvation-inducible PsiE family protein [Methanoregulaceae archaeon]